MLAAILDVKHLVTVFGYPLLFLIVMSESSGAPVPGETGLIAAAVLASQGKLRISSSSLSPQPQRSSATTSAM